MFIVLIDLSEITQLGSSRVGTEHRSPCDSQAPKAQETPQKYPGIICFKKITMGDF